MLAFVTTIRHPLNSNDYARVWDLLEDSLRSFLGQTVTDVRVIVVCNRIGSFRDPRLREDPRVHFVLVDFPPPVQWARAATGLPAVRRDRGCKHAIALCVAKRLRPDYLFFCDADDFVCADVAEIVAGSDIGCPGWYLAHGYRLKEGRVKEIDAFDRWCGTSHIVHTDTFLDAIGLGDLHLGSSAEEIFVALGEERVMRILGSHTFTREFMSDHGAPLEVFPQRAAMQRLATGENHSDFRDDPPSNSNIDDWQPLSDEQRRYFNLPPDIDLAKMADGGDSALSDTLGSNDLLKPRPQRELSIRLQRAEEYRSTESHSIEGGVMLALCDGAVFSLTEIENWLWQQVTQVPTVEALYDAAMLTFPERGAVIEAELRRAIASFSKRKILELLPPAA